MDLPVLAMNPSRSTWFREVLTLDNTTTIRTPLLVF